MRRNVRQGFKNGLIVLAVGVLAGCGTTPGGVAPSTTPLEGRNYTVIGKTVGTDSRIKLFGVLPISGSNTTRGGIESAQRRVGADALIDVTVDGYYQYWILFSRDITRVEGLGIRFTK